MASPAAAQSGVNDARRELAFPTPLRASPFFTECVCTRRALWRPHSWPRRRLRQAPARPQDPATLAVPTSAPQRPEGTTDTRVIVLDRPTAGNIAILLYAYHVADFEDFLAAAMPIVESLEFEPAPKAFLTEIGVQPEAVRIRNPAARWAKRLCSLCPAEDRSLMPAGHS